MTRSTLADANQQRDYRIFEEFAFFMVGEARKTSQGEIFNLGGKVYAFDSTTIPLCLSIFKWAKFRRRKGGVKAHVLYDTEAQVPSFYHITTASVHDAKAMAKIPYETGAYCVFDRGYNLFSELPRIHRLESIYVVRTKQNLQFKCSRWRRRWSKNVLTDAEIQLAGVVSALKYPDRLRLVGFYDAEQKRDFAFLTNAFAMTSTCVADLYRRRGQVEPFFKWLKQHLKIRHFWGNTENAVRIQVAAAISPYCLVAVAREKLKAKQSTYELLQILSASLLDKTPLLAPLEKALPETKEEAGTPFLPGFFD